MISTDGGSAFVNKLVGQVAVQINCKLCRISPYNSKANLSERWNKYALAALRIFHQSFTLTDDNYDLIHNLTDTNCVLVTFQKKFLQFHYKGEGAIPKNMCTLQKVSHLKPVKNVFKLLGLTVSQKLVMALDKVLKLACPTVNEVEIMPNLSVRAAPGTLIKRFNPSLEIVQSVSGSGPRLDKIDVGHPSNIPSIKDICQIKLKTYNESMETESLFGDKDDTLSTLPSQSEVSKKRKKIPDSLDSSSQCMQPSFIISDQYLSIDNFSLHDKSIDYEDSSSDVASEQHSVSEGSSLDIDSVASVDHTGRDLEVAQDRGDGTTSTNQDVLSSVRPRLSTGKGKSVTRKSVTTYVRLPS